MFADEVEHIRELARPWSEEGIGSWVYFIQAASGGPVKIGRSCGIVGRYEALQAASPERLVVRSLIPGGVKLERVIHYVFRDVRLHGEWFGRDNPEDILAFAEEARQEILRVGPEYILTPSEEDHLIEFLWNESTPKKEIAERLGITLGALDQRLQRMRRNGFRVQLRNVTQYRHQDPRSGYQGHSARTRKDFADEVIARVSAEQG